MWLWLHRGLGILPICALAATFLPVEPLCAGERKYLPRLGPSPIYFMDPVELPLPFRLPPLDMGVSEDEAKAAKAAKKAKEAEENAHEAAKKPARRTRTTAISSRPITSANSAPSATSTSVAGLQEGESMNSSSQADIDSLIPDGFDIGLGKSGNDRRDLSVFLNYFIGQSQKSAQNEKLPSPPPADDVVSP